MKAVFLPAACFVFGVGIGVFFAGASKSDQNPEKGRGEKKPVRISAITSSAKEEKKFDVDPRVATRRSLQDIAFDDEKLIDLASRASSTTSRMLDFERATAHLTSKELLALLDKAETLSVPYTTLNWARTNLLIRVALADPDAALERALTIKDQSNRDQAVDAVIAEISQNDVGLALDKAASLDPRRFRSVANAILTSGAEGAAAAVLAELDGKRDESLSNFKFDALGSGVGMDNLDQGMRIFDRLTSTASRTRFLSNALGNIVKSDPATALGLLEEHSESCGSRNRSTLMRSISSAWLVADAENARAWIQSLEDPLDRRAALEAGSSSSGEERQWLMDEIGTFSPDDPTASTLVSKVASEWGPREPEEVIQWIQQLPPGLARSNAISSGNFSGFAKNWARNDAEAAITWLESLDHTDSVRPKLIRAMSNGWASVDFAGAQEWVSEIPDDGARYNAMDAMIVMASGENLVSAREMLVETTADLSSEESDPLTAAVRHVAQNWAAEDPVSSFAWAESLANDSQRSSAIFDIAIRWKKIDPDGAREAVSRVELDEKFRESLLKRLSK